LGIFACSNQNEQVSSEPENAGFNEEKVIESTGDVREAVWYQLSLEDKERINLNNHLSLTNAYVE
jgi:hypothetical protein